MGQLFSPRMVLLLPLAGVVAIFIWAFTLPLIVNARAVSVAGGNPYCIQVRSSGSGYRPVSNWLDLTAFGMRVPFEGAGGSSEPQWTFHAVLVVDNRMYNWSHKAMDFLSISSRTARALYLRPSCIPD